MKSILFALALTIFGSAFASTVDRQTLRFDGSTPEATFQLRTEKTHTEYRYEQVQRICYRQEVTYRTVCRQPTPTTPGACWSEPVYRSVPYTCWETVAIPYEVFDYYVDAQVAVNFGELPAGLNASENITATLNGDILSLSSNGSKTLIVELARLEQNRNLRGSTMLIDAKADVKFHAYAPVAAALDMKNVSIKQNVMTYTLGPVAGLQLAHDLKIIDNPVLGSSTTLFNGEMGQALARTERGSVTDMRIAFVDVLGRQLGSGRYSITAEASFKAGVSVMNAAELEKLSASKTILYKR